MTCNASHDFVTVFPKRCIPQQGIAWRRKSFVTTFLQSIIYHSKRKSYWKLRICQICA